MDKKDLELAEREREKEEWVKKYQDLEARLKAEPEKSDQSQRVAELVHQGEFEEAGTLLDDALSESETDVERTAEYHYRRGRLFELQFEPLKALPHFESSYRYRPTSPEYAAAFAGLLQKQRQYDEADKVYSQNLRLLRVGAKDNPAAYLPNVAVTLFNGSMLFYNVDRATEGERSLQEATSLYRDLYEKNRSAFGNDLAKCLLLIPVYFPQFIGDSNSACEMARATLEAATDPQLQDLARGVIEEHSESDS